MNMKESLSGYPISEFINNFYGYGTYDSDYWFIGKEEGGGNTLKEIQERLSVWEQRGKRELEDIADYHLALDSNNPFFTHRYKIQPTWNKLIRIVLAAQQHLPTADAVREYQREKLGSPNGETCLLELLPLPSRSTGEWIYVNSSTIETLQTRETYRNHYAKSRAPHIKRKIAEHHPAAVVFYSFSGWYMDWWREIADTDFKSGEIDGTVYHSAVQGGIKFLVVKHPASRVCNEYYHKIGNMLIS